MHYDLRDRDTRELIATTDASSPSMAEAHFAKTYSRKVRVGCYVIAHTGGRKDCHEAAKRKAAH